MRHVQRSVISTSVSAVVALALVVLLASPLAAQRLVRADVWFDGGNSFERGAAAPLRVSADPGAHIAVVRVDGDGRFSVLWPPTPNARSNWSGPAGEAMVVPFRADATDGVGYVFAIASRTPFDFRSYRTSSGRWIVGTLAARVGGADPFALVDRFARNVTGPRADYTIAYAPYQTGSGSYHIRTAYGDRGAVYSPDGSYGYDSYGYGYGYGDAWIASPYQRQYRDYRYPPFSADPRTRYQRHCPDGTLAPFTTPCPPAFNGVDVFAIDGFTRDGFGRDGFNRRGFDRDGFDRDGFDRDGFDRDGFRRDGFRRGGFDDRRDGFSVFRGMAGARDGGLRLNERGRGRGDGRGSGTPRGGSPRGPGTMPSPTPLGRHR